MGVFTGADPVSRGAYTVRIGTEADVPALLDLHRDVFGTWPADAARAVFDWKFVDNPYLDDVPVFVATTGGEVVGAMGHVGYEMVVGDEALRGVQPTDLMVRRDHRRQGIHKAMIELNSSVPATGVLFFGVPATAPERSYRQAGRPLIENPIYARPLSPPAPDGEPLRRAANRLAVGGYRAYSWLLDRAVGAGDSYDVSVEAEPPVDRLTALYEDHVPSGVHVRRTPEFYNWRFADPLDDVSAYLVREDGSVVAAVVVSERGGTVLVRDVLPFDAAAGAIRAALAAVVADHRDRGFLCAWRPASMDAATLWSAGLVSSRVMPGLSYSTDLMTKPVDGSWTVGGRDLRDPDSWDIQLLARDY